MISTLETSVYETEGEARAKLVDNVTYALLTRSVRHRSVGRYVGQSAGRYVIFFLKGLEFTLPMLLSDHLFAYDL